MPEVSSSPRADVIAVRKALEERTGFTVDMGGEYGYVILGCTTLASKNASDLEMSRRIVAHLEYEGLKVGSTHGHVRVYFYFNSLDTTLEEALVWAEQLETARKAIDAAINWRISQEVVAGLRSVGWSKL